MYARLEELKKYQKDHKLGTYTLASKIGINYLTLKRILHGLPLYNSTEHILNSFLDNPKMNGIPIKMLIEHKKNSGLTFEQLSKEIGISLRTLDFAVRDLNVSENTKKLIQNYLQKVC